MLKDSFLHWTFTWLLVKQHTCAKICSSANAATKVTTYCKVWLAAKAEDRSQCLLCLTGKSQNCFYGWVWTAPTPSSADWQTTLEELIFQKSKSYNVAKLAGTSCNEYTLCVLLMVWLQWNPQTYLSSSFQSHAKHFFKDFLISSQSTSKFIEFP